MTTWLGNIEVLNNAIAFLHETKGERGIKQKGGKLYTMVQDRVEALRKYGGDLFSVETELLHYDFNDTDKPIVMRCIIRAWDTEGGRIVATGHAEEWRSQGYVNATSAVENAETSAIGRALASLGLHGGEFASANEIDVAVAKREYAEAKKFKGPPEVKQQKDTKIEVSRPASENLSTIAKASQTQSGEASPQHASPGTIVVNLTTDASLPTNGNLTGEVLPPSTSPPIAENHADRANGSEPPSLSEPENLSADASLPNAGNHASLAPDANHSPLASRPVAENQGGEASLPASPNPDANHSQVASQHPPANQMTSAPGWETMVKAVETFLPECNSRDDLKDFWMTNQQVIEDLKARAPKDFDAVRAMFTARRAFLEAKEKSNGV